MDVMDAKKRLSKSAKVRRSRKRAWKDGTLSGGKRRRISVSEEDGAADENDDLFTRPKIHHGVKYFPVSLQSNPKRGQEQPEETNSPEEIEMPVFEGRRITPKFRARPKEITAQAMPRIPKFIIVPKCREKQEEDKATSLKALQNTYASDDSEAEL